jgi:very-short-patch-repair endonuclease
MASHLEKKFSLFWKALGGPELKPEVKVLPTRRWRFDFAHETTRIAFEIEGGVWTGGRHTRGSGYSKDCEKYNEAALAGWTVFRITGDMITTPTIERLVKHVRLRALQLS